MGAVKSRDWEAELRAKEEFNFALFQHNPAPMTVVDRDGRAVKSNLARRNSPLPLPPLGEPLFGDEESAALQSVLLECIRSSKVQHLPKQRLGDGIFAITMAPVPAGAIVICEDITERQRIQDQLIQAQKMAALGTLVSGVAHEISNPNNVMLLSASALRKWMPRLLAILDRVEKAGDLDIAGRPYAEVRAELSDHVEVLQRAAERIENLVRELKDFARTDSGVMGTVDINQMVRNAVILLQPVLRKATRHFVADYAADLPPVSGNAQRLEQVVVNLLTNACQALPDPDRRISVATSFDPQARVVRIAVQDEGAGIPPENLARIKDPFFTTKRDAGGTGLGLSVSDKIVTAHGGTLSFRSSPQTGTTAIVSLPCPATPPGDNGRCPAKRAP